MNNGHITEDGTYDELMSRDSLFSTLYCQAAAGRTDTKLKMFHHGGADMNITKRHAAGVMFAFLRPYALPYGFGVMLYGTQRFGMSFIISMVISRLTAAMLSGREQQVWLTGAKFIGFFLAYFILLGIGTYLYVKQSERAQSDLKNRLFRSFVRTSVEETSHSGEGFSAINTDAGTALRLLDDSLIPFLSCVTAIFFSAAVIFSVDYRLGLISILVGVLAFLLQFRFSDPLRRVAEGRLEANREKRQIIVKPPLRGGYPPNF